MFAASDEGGSFAGVSALMLAQEGKLDSQRRTIASGARLAQQLAPGRNEREPEEHPGEREEPRRLACCCRDRRDQGCEPAD